MKKSKVLCLVVSALLAVSILTACSTSTKNEPAPAATPASDSSKEVKVDTVTVWSNDAHNKIEYEERIAEFNNTVGKEKGIVIDYTVYGSDYYSALDVAIKAGEAPYIFKCNKIGQYAASGDILALDDLPTGKDIITLYADNNAEDYGVFGGKTYSVPFRVVTFGLAYNVDMFKEMGLTPPTTWDEMRTVAKTITDNGKGQIYGYAFPMAYTSYRYQYVIHPSAASTGIEFFDHKTGKYNFQSLKPFFNHLMDIINDGSMFPGYQTMDDDTKRAQFSAGNIGMICIGSSDVGVLYDQFPCDFEWAVVPYPVQDASNRFKYPVNPSMFYVVNAKTVKDGLQDKVMEAYNWYLSDKTLALNYERGKDLPVLGEKITSLAGEVKRPQWESFANMSNYCIRLPYPESKVTVEGDAYNAVFDKILTKTVGVDEALQELDKRYNAALDAAIAAGKVDISMYIDKNYDERMTWGN